MLLNLPPDIFLIIIYFLPKIYDINILILTNKYIYNIIDNTYYICWANNLYGIEFWIRACKRTPEISKPLKSMKLELLRLELFNISLKNINASWNNNDYYKYWDMLEIMYKVTNLKKRTIQL
jgi:hypothetical protein